MSSHYRLRDAAREDVSRLVELLLRMDAHVAGIPRARLRPNAAGWQDLASRFESLISDDESRVTVATWRGRIVAMGNVRIWRHPDLWHNPERRGRSVAVIDDVWVEPRHRRRGLAGHLVAELVSFAVSRGVQDLMLEYSASNEEAESAWSSLGFRPTGVRAEASAGDVMRRLGRVPREEDEA